MLAVGNSSSSMLNGHLPLVLLISAGIAFPLSLFLLRLYKRAVLRSMKIRSATEKGVPLTVAPTEDRKDEISASALRSSALNSPWKVAAIYAVAGSAYATVMTSAFLLGGGIGFLPGRAFLLFLNYAWPIALAIMLIATPTWRQKAGVAGIYLLGLCSGGLLGLGWSQVVFLWVYINAAPTLLLALFLTRKIRAVGPMGFTFVLLAVIGCEIALDLLALDVNRGGLITRAALSVGFGATSLLLFVALAGLIGFSVLGWLAMKWIGRCYERKRISDQSITLDSVWIVFAVVHAVFLSLNGLLWSLGGIAALFAYKLALRIGLFFWIDGSTAKALAAPRLLLLRVFSLGRRGERMFDAVTKHWRYAGSIQLIAGPDLASSTIEPHEFLAFLGGKLSRTFIDGPAAFALRLKGMDLTPDFDGRFRVSDFFCQDDTWQMVLSRLLNASDAVLMDLRGFSRANAGCVFELRELMKLADPKRAVFVIDQTTDEAFLNETVQGAGFEFFRSSGGAADLPKLIGALGTAAA